MGARAILTVSAKENIGNILFMRRKVNRGRNFGNFSSPIGLVEQMLNLDVTARTDGQ